MTDKRVPLNDGYAPVKKGYQPETPATIPTGDPAPEAGYVPTSSEGDSPTNNPAPPGDE